MKLPMLMGQGERENKYEIRKLKGTNGFKYGANTSTESRQPGVTGMLKVMNLC